MRYIVVGFLLFTILSLSSSQNVPAYPCNVQGCQTCSYYNVCGVCKNNYILQINTTTSMSYCAQVFCPENCTTCLSNYTCQVCDNGFYVTSQGFCSQTNPNITCPAYCLACNQTTNCQLCQYGYNIQSGLCLPNFQPFQNCVAQFSFSRCQVCETGYMPSIGYNCINTPGFSCNVTNCFQCDIENNKCSTCLPGYKINLTQGCTKLTCNITNCTSCLNSTTCQTCANSYTLSNNTCLMNIYPCDISNCLSCIAANTCFACADGYQLLYNNSQDFTVGSYCSKYTKAVGLNSQFMNNCQTLGALPFGGIAVITVGCLQCEQNYLNIGGLCVANLTISNYTCNIENCVFCIQNDFCGQCAQGYVILSFTGGICSKMYSPLPYCKSTLLFAPICQACQDGYILNHAYQCVKMANMTCNVNGCAYCLSQNNKCHVCRAGFNQIDTSGNITCQAMCDITNCYQCASNITCNLCDGGYVLSNDSTQCQLGTSVTVNCSIYNDCQECNALYCTKCISGYTLNNATNTCCVTPLQDQQGCAVYEDVCSATCTSCKLGYYKFLDQCITLPCSISNCAYCFRLNQCVLCSEGYTLVNNTCTIYTKPSTCTANNCVSCNSNGTCNTCITGYVLYKGSCVCNFQNCLSCLGEGFCNVCAFPTIQTYINNAGCLPQIVAFTLCNVANCINCKSVNQCSECDLGFTLQPNGTCIRNPCVSSTNCLLCSNNQNYCFTCKTGYIQNNFLGNSCVQIAQNYQCEVFACSVCSTSSTCQTCLQGYKLTTDKTCQRLNCLENCLVCFQDNNCTLCDPGYFLSTAGTCAPNTPQVISCTIDFCISCSKSPLDNVTQICDTCDFGLSPSTDKLSCVPASCSSPNCQLCFDILPVPIPASPCLVCQQGYFMNSYFQCVKYSPNINTPSCDVYNCLYCHVQNQCGFCLPGWNSTNGLCITNLFCQDSNCETCTNATFCVSCVTQYKSTLGVCQPQCNITNCASCATPTTCGTCNNTYILSANNKTCSCKSTFVSINNTCVCPANDTEFNGTCFSCNVVNCTQCIANNVCSTCNTSYVLKSNNCSCPDSTFEIKNGLCQCPTGKLVFGTGDNLTCITCNVSFCSSCSSANTCATCNSTFQLNNNKCQCPDSTFNLTNNTCLCPTGKKQFDNTCVNCNITYCAFCQTPNVCSQCSESFEFGQDNNTCICPTGTTLSNDFCYACDIQYCSVCNATNICSTCDATFNISNNTCICGSGFTFFNSSCVACNISNCTTCQQPNVCATCNFLYSNINGTCISCDVKGCQTCQTPNYCQTCLNNEQISSTGTCISCQIPGCNICSSNTTCVSCNDGLTFNSNFTSCLNCSVTGCFLCSANNTCSVCLPGFTLSSGQCTVCASPCLTCNSNGSCVTCVSPFSNTASNGTCFKCNIRYCYQCSSATSNTCTQCQAGFSLSSNNQTCQRICGSVFCTECTSSTQCTKCIGGYTPSAGGCKVCQASNCLTCLQSSPQVCVQCGLGYYLQDGTCYACSSATCETCNSTTCFSFKQSTGLKPFINNKGKVTPVLCNLQCLSCSSINPQICLTCKPGYALVNGNCISCQFPCKTCADNSPTTCLSCYGSGFLSNSQCKTCTTSSNCLTCLQTNLTQCDSCPYGFSLAINNTCVKGCPTYCLSCKNATFCDVCQSGFSANSEGVCLPCLSNCRQCSGTNQAICLTCGQNFYLNANGVCESCPEFCLSCTPQSKCQSCVIGYTLTPSFTCAKNCKNPCATCSQTNPASCFSCIGGYSYDSTTNACNPVVNCTGGVCELCPFGYTLSGGKCVTCNSTCARCSPTNNNTCTSCYDGNYLSNSNCVACPVGCETCSSGTNCLTCQAGYTAQASPVLTTISCVQCSGLCSRCIGSPTTCTACKTGYVLVGWTCLSTFNFGFEMTLNATLSTFFSNYQSFLSAIANTVNSSALNSVTIQNITQGSVIVNGNVTTVQASNSNSAQTQFNNLGSLLSQGASIANMPIISSQINANGGVIPSDGGNNNLAIILGVCIPVGVILIGLLIYCCCVKKSSAPQSDYSEKNMEPGTTVRQTFELSRDNTQRIETIEKEEN